MNDVLAHPAVTGLPVTEAVPDLLAALRGSSAAVLVAAPGAGKTTVIPLVLARSTVPQEQRVVLLEPRRLAARAAAARMAVLLG
jgi:ATP-dependent helicase HrpB